MILKIHLTACNAGYVQWKNAGADPQRFQPFYGNRWHFRHNNTFLIIRTHSTLKSGQYPVWMTQKPRKGDFRSKNPKTFPRGAPPPPPDPSRILRLRRSFRKSVSIYPRSAPASMRTHIFAKQCNTSTKVITNSEKAGTLWKASGFWDGKCGLKLFDSKSRVVYELRNQLSRV